MKITIRFQLPPELVEQTRAALAGLSPAELAAKRQDFEKEMEEKTGVAWESIRADMAETFGIDPEIGLPFTKENGEVSHEDKDVEGEDAILSMDEAIDSLDPPSKIAIAKMIVAMLILPESGDQFLAAVLRAAKSMYKESRQ